MATERKPIPRPCQICQHDSRLAIDQAILNGKGVRAIARDFSIGSGKPGTDSFKPDHKKVTRHIERCMGEAYQKAKDADLEASGLALVNRMKMLDEVADEVIARHREGIPLVDAEGIPVLDPETGHVVRQYKDSTLLGAIREARRNTEMRAKLAGAVVDGPGDLLDRNRAALASPEARRLLAELDALTGKDDQELPT